MDGVGGNPAGVVLDASGVSEQRMQEIAAEVGYSETAFLTTIDASTGRFRVRYFSPKAEVAFCGHATIAAAVAVAEREGPGTLHLATAAGEVSVDTDVQDGRFLATLSSVATRVRDVGDDDLTAALAALRWTSAELDPTLPPRIAHAGNDHLVLAAATHEPIRRCRMTVHKRRSSCFREPA